MKITKRQLRRIIKEEKARLLREQKDAKPAAGGNGHHWPRVDWSNVGELVDKWSDSEEKAFDKGDPSMMAMGDNATEAKAAWSDQVEQASMEMEAELTDSVRALALKTMQKYTDMLINGDFA
tara:strand:- start:391 stop:756 length:366 start_codon:yes stop_codon:yes gene_type:complete